jgi:alpha 1,3-glucosidase
LVGRDILVVPVTKAAVQNVLVNFPGANEVWYDLQTLRKYSGGSRHSMIVSMDDIPVYQRGGSIIPKKERTRRSTSQMINDPLTLVVALDSNGAAKGEVYLDDMETHKYQKGEYLLTQFRFEKNRLVSEPVHRGYSTNIHIERIVVLGVEKAPSSVTSSSGSLDFEFDRALSKLTIRNPKFNVGQEWSVSIQ